MLQHQVTQRQRHRRSLDLQTFFVRDRRLRVTNTTSRFGFTINTQGALSHIMGTRHAQSAVSKHLLTATTSRLGIAPIAIEFRTRFNHRLGQHLRHLAGNNNRFQPLRHRAIQHILQVF